MCRVAIIGAGPAGCALAATLGDAQTGDAQTSVTLVESRAYPRAKVCGEFVSPAAGPILESLVGVGALLEAGARRVDRIEIELGDRRRSWTMPTSAWALSRSRLDGLLVDRACRAGVRVLQPMRVAAVESRDDGVSLRLADGSCVDADLVVHADGSGRLDPAGPTPMARGLVGHKCHLRLAEPITSVRMRAGRGGYVGLIGVEGGLATVALAARRGLIASARGDADAMLAGLWPGYDRRWRVSDWLACGIARSGYVPPGHPRSFRIGNAAGAVDPIGGEGIGLGLWAGVTLGGLIAAARPGGVESCRGLQRRFARVYRRRLRWRRGACRVGAELLMRPRLVRAAWPVLGWPAATIQPWYALTGKPRRA